MSPEKLELQRDIADTVRIVLDQREGRCRYERQPHLDMLFGWVRDEPRYRRFEILFDGEMGDHEDDLPTHRPAWRVRVWSQRKDGTPRKTPGEGRADELAWAAFLALKAYFDTPREPVDE